MSVDSHRPMVYQVRAGPDRSPDDVVTELTHAAWKALMLTPGLKSLDPHRWPVLYADFGRVFKRRLAFHEGCGTLHECRGVVWNDGGAFTPSSLPAGPMYILVLKGGLIRFVDAMAALACRRFRAEIEPAAQRHGSRARVRDALQRALASYLFFNEACSGCRMHACREKAPDVEGRLPQRGPHGNEIRRVSGG